MLKVNNKDIRTTSLMSGNCLLGNKPLENDPELDCITECCSCGFQDNRWLNQSF